MAFIEPVIFILPEHRPDPIGEFRNVIIFGDHDEALPAVHANLGQCHVFAFEMLEIPIAGNFLQLAVIGPGHAVKRAAELIDLAGLGAQFARAMKADIVEGAYVAVLLPDQQE